MLFDMTSVRDYNKRVFEKRGWPVFDLARAAPPFVGVRQFYQKVGDSCFE